MRQEAFLKPRVARSIGLAVVLGIANTAYWSKMKFDLHNEKEVLAAIDPGENKTVMPAPGKKVPEAFKNANIAYHKKMESFWDPAMSFRQNSEQARNNGIMIGALSALAIWGAYFFPRDKKVVASSLKDAPTPGA